MSNPRNNSRVDDGRCRNIPQRSHPKQQATGYNSDHHIIEQRKKAELQRNNEENHKLFSLQTCRNRFEEVTERKNINSTVKNMVVAGMKGVYYDLENRRDRLRILLREEEAYFRKEMQERAASMGHQVYIEKQLQAEEQRRKKEEERKKLVEEKRMQQFLNNYEPFRTMFVEKNNRQTFCAQLEQLKELEEQRHKELAVNTYWEETERKILEMKAREEEAKNRESKKKMQDIAKELLRQQVEREELMAQKEALKAEELREIEKQKEKARLEEIEEKRQTREKREAFQKLLQQQIAEREAFFAQQNESDEAISRHMAETANKDLTHELIQRKKLMEETRKEMIYYKEYMEELKKERSVEEKRIDELVEEQRKYLDKLRVDKLCQEKEAREILTKQVLEQRKKQVEEREKAAAMKKELELFEAQVAERRRLDNLQSQEIESFKAARVKNKYALELKQQMEEIQQIKEKEKEEADRLMKKEMMAEKDYLQKAEEILNTRISKKIHPFLATVNDFEIPTDCKGTF